MTNIVGAPSTADAAISIAASIDYMEQNWKFPAVQFSSVANPKLLVKAVEGGITKPIKEAGNVRGKLVYIGDATSDLSQTQLDELKGHVALIDRGTNPFVEKMSRAKGAIGVVMVNNVAGNPIVMGGSGGTFDFPSIMITKALGDAIKEDLKNSDVTIHFQTGEFIETPEVIDTLTDFSSQGPRSLDSAIKPEISAPGLKIISASMGGGDAAVQLGGTSMSAPPYFRRGGTTYAIPTRVKRKGYKVTLNER